MVPIVLLIVLVVVGYVPWIGLWRRYSPPWAAARRLIRRARTHAAAGALDEADALLDRALARVPRHADAWLGKANVLLQQQRVPEALGAVDRALAERFAGDRAPLFRLRALLLYALGRYAEALAAFDLLRLGAPADAQAHAYRVGALWRLGRREEALAACERALVHVPPGPERTALWADRASLLLTLRSAPEETLEACAHVLDAGPGAPIAPDGVRADAWHSRALALLELGRTEEALAAAGEAAQLAPGSGNPLAAGALALAALGRGDEARAEAERALEAFDRFAAHAREQASLRPGVPTDPLLEAAEWAGRRDALRVLGRDDEAEAAAGRAGGLAWPSWP